MHTSFTEEVPSEQGYIIIVLKKKVYLFLSYCIKWSQLIKVKELKLEKSRENQRALAS